MQPYRPEIELAMKKYYATLSEKDQRYYAAVEALKLDLGGQSYIARILGCSEKSIYRGLKELAALPDEPKYDPAIRKPGGGRKGYADDHPEIDAQFLDVLKNHTAGDPMDEKVIWTDLTPDGIAKLLEQDHRVKVSKSVVNKLLKKHNYRRRKAQKKQTIKSVPNRNAQFLNIQVLVDEYLKSENPIISFDTKIGRAHV